MITGFQSQGCHQFEVPQFSHLCHITLYLVVAQYIDDIDDIDYATSQSSLENTTC